MGPIIGWLPVTAAATSPSRFRAGGVANGFSLLVRLGRAGPGLIIRT